VINIPNLEPLSNEFSLFITPNLLKKQSFIRFPSKHMEKWESKLGTFVNEMYASGQLLPHNIHFFGWFGGQHFQEFLMAFINFICLIH